MASGEAAVLRTARVAVTDTEVTRSTSSAEATGVGDDASGEATANGRATTGEGGRSSDCCLSNRRPLAYGDCGKYRGWRDTFHTHLNSRDAKLTQILLWVEELWRRSFLRNAAGSSGS